VAGEVACGSLARDQRVQPALNGNDEVLAKLVAAVADYDVLDVAGSDTRSVPSPSPFGPALPCSTRETAPSPNRRSHQVHPHVVRIEILGVPPSARKDFHLRSSFVIVWTAGLWLSLSIPFFLGWGLGRAAEVAARPAFFLAIFLCTSVRLAWLCPR